MVSYIVNALKFIAKWHRKTVRVDLDEFLIFVYYFKYCVYSSYLKIYRYLVFKNGWSIKWQVTNIPLFRSSGVYSLQETVIIFRRQFYYIPQPHKFIGQCLYIWLIDQWNESFIDSHDGKQKHMHFISIWKIWWHMSYCNI